jgi:hypothetical protein
MHTAATERLVATIGASVSAVSASTLPRVPLWKCEMSSSASRMRDEM